MDIFTVVFPVSGVKTSILIPPFVALVVSTLTSMGGVSGAFLLLPFQMSFLGFTSPAVSSTNFVYNIVAIPSGVYRYFKEGRMAWPLTWVVIAGTLPGVFIGVVMGRNAGFLTAAASLGRKYEDDGPHYVYVPERPFSEEQFLRDMHQQ